MPLMVAATLELEEAIAEDFAHMDFLECLRRTFGVFVSPHKSAVRLLSRTIKRLAVILLHWVKQTMDLNGSTDISISRREVRNSLRLIVVTQGYRPGQVEGKDSSIILLLFTERSCYSRSHNVYLDCFNHHIAFDPVQ